MFLSTPPSRVATLGVGELNVSVYVSIHATLAGGDLVPRTRPRRASLFLSTPPSRVATRCLGVGSCALWRFYPRHPRGWRQARNWKARQNFSCFYPRHPRGWRPPNQQRDQRDGRVSIHATLAGGDAYSRKWSAKSQLFLSTPPSRVATSKHILYTRIIETFLSTPPSRVATTLSRTRVCAPAFLSTPPSRVATRFRI